MQFIDLPDSTQQTMDLEEALTFCKNTLLKRPNDVSCHTNLSNIYAAMGNVEEALKHVYQALRLQPQHAISYNNLGRLLYKQGQIEKSVTHFEKALRMDPNYWEAHYNLAHSFVILNQINRAAAHYQEVIRIFPDHAAAHYNLGLLCIEEQNFAVAEKHLNKALALDPQNADAAKFLGQVYVELGHISRAINLYEQALALSPTLAEAHHNLAVLYLRNQDHTQALKHFTAALSLDPNNDTAKHISMALSHSTESATAPTQYIVQLFDQYAPYYDEQVKIQLKYQAPGLLRNAIGRCLGKNPKALRVLDLGCGTGQCGIVFRDLALELTGIDLSPKMIAEASRLNAYEKLLVTDLNQYLQDKIESFDLIIAADVFCYSGTLNTIFHNVAKALTLNGWFAFTIESLDNTHNNSLPYPASDPNLLSASHIETALHCENKPYLSDRLYALQPSGRFAHSRAYIHGLTAEYRFSFELSEDIILREHQGAPVHGQLYVLRN